MYLFKVVLIIFLINWIISMQMINQSSSDTKQKIISIFLGIVFSTILAIIIL